MHRSRVVLIGFCALLSAVGVANALEIVNFDDITTSGGWAMLPTNYGGLAWAGPDPDSGWEVATYTLYSGSYGNTNDTVSGPNFAYNDTGSLTMRTYNLTDFALGYLYADSWRYNNGLANSQSSQNLTLTAMNEGIVVGTYFVDFSGPAGMRLIDPGWDNLAMDELRFTASAQGSWWRLDNMAYVPNFVPSPINGVVPEPASMLIMGLGIVGMAVRKKLSGLA
jgi:hypothetical protein